MSASSSQHNICKKPGERKLKKKKKRTVRGTEGVLCRSRSKWPKTATLLALDKTSGWTERIKERQSKNPMLKNVTFGSTWIKASSHIARQKRISKPRELDVFPCISLLFIFNSAKSFADISHFLLCCLFSVSLQKASSLTKV